MRAQDVEICTTSDSAMGFSACVKTSPEDMEILTASYSATGFSIRTVNMIGEENLKETIATMKATMEALNIQLQEM